MEKEMFDFDVYENEEDEKEGKEFDVQLVNLIKKIFYQLYDRNSEKKKGIKNYKNN